MDLLTSDLRRQLLLHIGDHNLVSRSTRQEKERTDEVLSQRYYWTLKIQSLLGISSADIQTTVNPRGLYKDLMKITKLYIFCADVIGMLLVGCPMTRRGTDDCVVYCAMYGHTHAITYLLQHSKTDVAGIWSEALTTAIIYLHTDTDTALAIMSSPIVQREMRNNIDGLKEATNAATIWGNIKVLDVLLQYSSI